MSSSSSKRTKSSTNSTFLSRHRARTRFKPSRPPHYYYTSLPNDSFVSDPNETLTSTRHPSPSSRLTANDNSESPYPTWALCLTLQNSGSVARDHLSCERTFLAYMRTSLALASAGVGLVQLFTVATATGHLPSGHRLHYFIQPVGAAVIVLGLMVLLIGVTRYFSVQTALTKGYFPVARIVTAFMTLALAVVTILTFGILMTGKLGPKAKLDGTLSWN